jgi:2-C-methyl-D-erythritol 4-phosphate cytidylyltransferase
MGGTDKLFADLCGKPLLYWSLLAFEQSPPIDEIIIVLNQSNLPIGRKLVEKEGFSRVTAIIHGGDRRQDSVQEGLKQVTGEIVLIHDGARPNITTTLIERVAAGTEKTGACIPVVQVTDTIKTENNGFVNKTLPREDLRAVQTPQAFQTSLIRMAYQRVTGDVTDDAQIIEIAGGKVSLTEGSYDNIKVTTPSDLELIQILIRKRGGVK